MNFIRLKYIFLKEYFFKTTHKYTFKITGFYPNKLI